MVMINCKLKQTDIQDKKIMKLETSNESFVKIMKTPEKTKIEERN